MQPWLPCSTYQSPPNFSCQPASWKPTELSLKGIQNSTSVS